MQQSVFSQCDEGGWAQCKKKPIFTNLYIQPPSCRFAKCSSDKLTGRNPANSPNETYYTTKWLKLERWTYVCSGKKKGRSWNEWKDWSLEDDALAEVQQNSAGLWRNTPTVWEWWVRGRRGANEPRVPWQKTDERRLPRHDASRTVLFLTQASIKCVRSQEQKRWMKDTYLPSIFVIFLLLSEKKTMTIAFVRNCMKYLYEIRPGGNFSVHITDTADRYDYWQKTIGHWWCPMA